MVCFLRQLELKPRDLANVAYTINLANNNLLNQLLSGKSQYMFVNFVEVGKTSIGDVAT